MKKRALWFPGKGIDKTSPTSIGEVCSFASDAESISVYTVGDIVTTRRLESVFGMPAETIYGAFNSGDSIALAVGSGLYVDGLLKYSTTYSSYVWIADWYGTKFVSDGKSWRKVLSDGTDYEIGISPPTRESISFSFNPTASGTSANWDATTYKLTDSSASFTSDLVGMYIQLKGNDFWTTGIVGSVDSSTELTVTDLEFSVEIPATATGTMAYGIGPVMIMSEAQRRLWGSVTVYYKIRYSRPDGTKSCTKTVDASESFSDNLVGRFYLSGIPSDVPDDVNEIEIFRLDTSVESSSLYRLVGSVSPGTTTFLDDVDLSEENEALTDDNRYPCPDVLKGILFYGFRLWGFSGNKVYYSEPYETTSSFEYFGSAGMNYFEFPSEVRTIVDSGRTLIVFLAKEIWVIEGLNPETANQRRLSEDIGTYGNLSATRYSGNVYTVSEDLRFWQVTGSGCTELKQVSSVLPRSPRYIQVVGSNGSIWISTGDSVIRVSMSNEDVWLYGMSGYVFPGPSTTYLGASDGLYTIDGSDGTYLSGGCYVESPYIFIGQDVGTRGKLSRLMLKVNCPSGKVSVSVDDKVIKEFSFSTNGLKTIVKHFWPAQGYYAKVKISGDSYLRISGPVVLNPW